MKICLECEGITDAPQDHCASCEAPLIDTRAVHFPLRRGEEDAGNPLLGTVVDGKYLVQGVLGKGGMGTVYRAMHQVSLVPVALKILNPRFSARGEYRDYFVAEAQKAGRVVHEHAGRVLDVGEAEDGTVYIAMEEVNGVTLHECMYGEVPLAPAVVVDILVQICRALAAAHDVGLVHRDLTPRNVMVVIRAGTPFIKILDFGIAKGVPHGAAGELDPELLQAPSGFANPPYSAPEYLEGQEVDARGDLYSVGVIAWEALTRTLPVEPGSPEATAAATVRGQLLPWPATVGVPASLVRLIRRLLARDPERRPASALEVLDELEAIRQPGSRVIRDVAVLLFLVATVILVFTYTDRTEPLLQLRAGALELHPPGAAPPPAVPVQSARVAEGTFDYAGFRAGDLVAEVAGEGEPARTFPLGAREQGDGTLVLDAARSPGYRALLDHLARRSRAADVTFRVPGQPSLGRTRLWIDDTAPRLTLARAGGSGPLNAASRLEVVFDDETPARLAQELTLECRKGGEVLRRIDLRGRDLDLGLDCKELLASLQEGTAPLGDVELTLKARDQAGNRAAPVQRTFDRVDFAVPGIKTQGELQAVFDDATRKGATLTLDLDGEEPGLVVAIAPVGGSFVEVPAQTLPNQLNLGLSAKVTRGFAAATYQIRIRDVAGNEQTVTRHIGFSSRGGGFALVDAEPLRDKLVTLVPGAELVWSGAELTCRVRCSPIYRPDALRLLGGDMELRGVAALRDAVAGGGTLDLAAGPSAPPDGVYTLELTLGSDVPGVATVYPRMILRLLRRSVRLHLPDTSGVRFYREAVAADGPFKLDGAEHPRLLPSVGWWTLDPPDARLVHGDAHWVSAQPVGVESERIAWGDSAGARLLPPRPTDRLRAGLNRLGLALFDRFGRPVQVLRGDRPAPAMDVPGVESCAEIVAFQYQDSPVRPQVAPVLVEYRQRTRVAVETGYRFAAADAKDIRLGLDSSRSEPVPCRRLSALPDGGSLLEFELPFGQVAGGAAESVELRGDGYEFELELRLFTPAFNGTFTRKVKSIRSSLREVRLGAFGDPPRELADLRMVPVLPAFDAVFRDPVAPELRQRGWFLRKQGIDVSDMRDVYLQAAELTGAQYGAIVDSFAGLPGDQRPDPATIHHPDDPLRAGRLQWTGMVPLGFAGGVASWRQAVAGNPGAPVTGVAFYQAFAVARMAGFVLFRNPAALRLPFGAELELAALGEGPAGRLNGVRRAATRAALLGGGEVVTKLGTFHGLDFGVCEWVQDIPWPHDPLLRPTVAGIIRNHQAHLRQAVTGPTDFTPAQRLEHQRLAVVRGRSLADGRAVIDAATGRELGPAEPLTPGVPGVVTTVHVPRDGKGLDGMHRLLPLIGLRLAGGEAFVDEVRRR